MMKYCDDLKLKEKYNGATMANKRVPMQKYGFDESWYGGVMRYVGELENNPILLLLGDSNRTLALAVEDKNEFDLSPEERKLRWHPPLSDEPIEPSDTEYAPVEPADESEPDGVPDDTLDEHNEPVIVLKASEAPNMKTVIPRNPIKSKGKRR